MCDFKPGDELVALDENQGALDGTAGGPSLEVGRVYTCDAVFDTPDRCPLCESTLGVSLVEVDNRTHCYCPCGFRKVERRNDSLSIEAFLTIKPGQYEEPKRAPAKKRERV
jgi:hypothetical protein